jgi:hypothetical protein
MEISEWKGEARCLPGIQGEINGFKPGFVFQNTPARNTRKTRNTSLRGRFSGYSGFSGWSCFENDEIRNQKSERIPNAE